MWISFSKQLRINWGVLKTVDLQLPEEVCCCLWPLTSWRWVFRMPNPSSGASSCNCTSHLESENGHCGHCGLWTLWTVDTVDSLQWSFLPIPPTVIGGWEETTACGNWNLLRKLFGEFHHRRHVFSDLNDYIVVGSGDFEILWNASWCSRSKNGFQNASFEIVWCVKQARDTFQ